MLSYNCAPYSADRVSARVSEPAAQPTPQCSTASRGWSHHEVVLLRCERRYLALPVGPALCRAPGAAARMGGALPARAAGPRALRAAACGGGSGPVTALHRSARVGARRVTRTGSRPWAQAFSTATAAGLAAVAVVIRAVRHGLCVRRARVFSSAPACGIVAGRTHRACGPDSGAPARRRRPGSGHRAVQAPCPWARRVLGRRGRLCAAGAALGAAPAPWLWIWLRLRCGRLRGARHGGKRGRNMAQALGLCGQVRLDLVDRGARRLSARGGRRVRPGTSRASTVKHARCVHARPLVAAV